MVPEDEELPWELPARWAEPAGSSGSAGTRPRHRGSGRTAAATSWRCRGPACRGERGALRLGTRAAHGTAAGTKGPARRNLPVPMILSILILALSSSLAKRCTACKGSSQVSGSMYVLLVGILTAGKAERAHEKGLAELPPTRPRKHPRSYPSAGLLAGLTSHLFISKAKDLALRLLDFSRD